jgi:Zn-dependent alcohol dehydrogenase
MVRSRAAILAEHGKPLVIDEVEYGSPGPGQLLVKLFASGICHSQLHQIHDANFPTPALLGHEATGIVEAAGSGVDHVREGDRVFVTWVPRNPRNGRPAPPAAMTNWRGRRTGSRNVYTWAEHVLCDEAYIVPMSGGVPTDVTAIIGCAVITGCGAVTNTVNVQAGETVAVFGAGGVGLCVIQAASNVGAGMIIAVDLDDKKLDFAREFGATHFVNASQTDAVAEVKALSNGGVDYAFDAIGVAKTMSQIVLATRPNNWGVGPGGTAVLVGVPQGPATIDARQLLVGERIFRGSLGGSGVPDRDFQQYLDWFQAGKLPLDKLVTRRYRLDEINDAVHALESGEIFGRSIIEYT